MVTRARHFICRVRTPLRSLDPVELFQSSPVMRRRFLLLSFIVLAALSGCSASFSASSIPRAGSLPARGQPSCADAIVSRVYFGANSSAGPVTDDAWRQFLEQSVTPKFPDGLTVVSGEGQWRGKSGAIDRERSRVLEVVHADDTESRAKVTEIANAYRTRFRQEAVMIVRHVAEQCF